jgi:hypothetical protein
MIEEATSKPNRRKRQEPKTHAVVKGAPPPMGTHRPDEKSAARKKAERIRKARRA